MDKIKKVKVLGINAGPRLGNTSVLVKEALKAAGEMEAVETEFISMHEHPVNPCNVCKGKRLCYGDVKGFFPDSENYCYAFGKKDEGNMFVDRVRHCDGLILGSPTHEWDVSCECKALMSRLRPFCEHVFTPFSGMMHNKPIGAVTTSFNKFGGAESTIFSILRWGMGVGMIPVGSETTEPERAPTSGPFGGIGNVGDGKVWWDTEAILPENSRISPPTTAVQALKASRCVGRNVAMVALCIKNGEALLEEKGYSLPKTSLPAKWPKALLKKGSYMEYLVKEGKVEVV
ncbi:MAG: flavodoxin family protein [Chloroflexi bacterium]|nr:flavodoxin family protein [Chloroflexota bacterium]